MNRRNLNSENLRVYLAFKECKGLAFLRTTLSHQTKHSSLQVGVHGSYKLPGDIWMSSIFVLFLIISSKYQAQSWNITDGLMIWFHFESNFARKLSTHNYQIQIEIGIQLKIWNKYKYLIIEFIILLFFIRETYYFEQLQT